MPIRFTTTMLIVLLIPSLVSAHDLWIIPPEAVAGKPTTIRAVSGTKFPKSDHAPDPAKFARRVVVLPDGTEKKLEAAGIEGDYGLLRFTPADAGIYAVAVETTPKIIKLEATAFNEYLVSDGLPHIFLLRSKEGTLDRPATEQYTKSPKALVRVGAGGKGDPTKPVGLPLEIIPLKNPFTSKPGDALKIRVLFKGKPLVEANLGWDHPGGGDSPVGTVRTDEKGEALVPVAKAGLMTIRLTHMTRPRAAEYEWESFWTTLTFLVPE